MIRLSDRQDKILGTLCTYNYMALSVTEAMDPEIEGLFTKGLVISYAVSGHTNWHLTDKGRQYLRGEI